MNIITNSYQEAPETLGDFILLPYDPQTVRKIRQVYSCGRMEPVQLNGSKVYCYVAGRRNEDRKKMVLVYRDGEFNYEPASRFSGICHTGDLTIDMDNDQVWKGSKLLQIPGAAMAILKSLLINQNMFVSRSLMVSLLERRLNHIIQDNTLSVQIARLRKALGKCGGQEYIVTLSGRGYRWSQPVRWEQA